MSTFNFQKTIKFCTYLKIFFLLVLIIIANFIKPHHTVIPSQSNINYLQGIDQIDEINQLGITQNSFDQAVKPSKDNLRINAINPGYTVNEDKNVGEFIEISKLSDDLILLAGLLIIYTNSNGNSSVLYEFSGDDYLAGEALLLRLESSLNSDQSNLTYKNQIAFSASLSLEYEGEKFSSICWTGKDGCSKSFNSKSPTVLIYEKDIDSYQHVDEYEPNYIPENLVKKESEPIISEEDLNCRELQFTEILTYYDESKEEQFVELYNKSSNTINIANCQIRYKNKIYNLIQSNDLIQDNKDVVNNGDLKPKSYYIYRSESFALTKNPNKENSIELLDQNNQIIDILTYYHGQKKSTSYSLIANEWKMTYNITPGQPNVFQKFQTCEEGKIINEETGNCIKMDPINITENCPEGKYRNPETGRCKSYDSEKEPTPCAEGYERNPETNRCRKIVNNDGESYPVVPVTGDSENNKNIVMLLIVVVAIFLGLIYVIYQFRKDIIYKIKKFIKRKKR